MPRAAAPTFAYTPATLPADLALVRLGPPRGSHNFDAAAADGAALLVALPSKVRRVSYAARGSFAVVKVYGPSEQGALDGEIVHVVSAPELKQWRRAGEWPKEFEEAPVGDEVGDGGEGSEDDLPANTNRRFQVRDESSSDDEDEDEDEDGDEDGDEDDDEGRDEDAAIATRT